MWAKPGAGKLPEPAPARTHGTLVGLVHRSITDTLLELAGQNRSMPPATTGAARAAIQAPRRMEVRMATSPPREQTRHGSSHLPRPRPRDRGTLLLSRPAHDRQSPSVCPARR